MTRKKFFWAARRVLEDYRAKIGAFTPNARLYLINVMILGVASGVFRLLFNFYVLSLGYDQVILGGLVTTNNLTALLAALPMGYLADLLGRKRSLILSGFLMSISILSMVIWPHEIVFYAMNVVSGLAQSLAAITNAPFLMENSGQEERTYLFSFSLGLQMAMASAGNWLGGYLPTWVSQVRVASPVSSEAYGGALLVTSLLVGLGIVPLAFLRVRTLARADRTIFAPISYAAKQPILLGKLIAPMLVTSIGAGLVMPFMNVFYRVVYYKSDTVIGALFAWGSLAMGIGLLLAPPLADRMGKIQVVVVSQALSVPFLIMMGFSPVFWLSAMAYYFRLTLMNMSLPVYDTYVMERVEPSARAMVASLVSMASNFGWAFSPIISGWLQQNYGFGPAFMGTILLYILSIYLYWSFFWRRGSLPVQLAQATE